MSNKRNPSVLPIQRRAAVIDAKPKEGERLSGADPGQFSFAVSSEEPYLRNYWQGPGNEILLHNKDNVRTERLDQGMVPLLFNHDMDKQLGIVDSYQLKDGTLHVSGRFGPSPLAQEKRADYDAGILKAASVGYRVHKMVRTESEDENGDPIEGEPARCEVKDWEPFDASLVSVPADPTVGVGRSESGEKEFPVEVETIMRRSAEPAPVAQPQIEVQPEQEKRNMAETANTPSPAELELKRVQDILAVAGDKDFGKHVSQDEVRKAIEDKTTADAFKDTVIRKIIDASDATKVGTMGDRTFASADAKDQKRYSIVNLIRAAVNQMKPGTFRPSEASFEREMSTELAKRLGKTPEGVYVPLGAFTRALGTQTIAGASGQLALTSEAAAVETITRPEVIELLRHRARVQQLGARTLGGLQGIVRLPRQSAAGTWQWLGEGQNVTPSDLNMDFVAMQPCRGSTQSAIDIELLASTSPDVEGLMRADFNKIRNLGIDYAAINGPVGGPGPLGLLNATGLATITPSGATMPSGGKFLSYVDCTAFETSVASADADVATSGWMLTPETRGGLKTTPKFTNTSGTLIAEPIWKEGPKDPNGLEDGPLGYKAGVTNQLPKNLTHVGVTGNVLHAGIFGDWSQMILADWGVVEVIFDPYTQAGSGAIVLTMRSMHDVALRHIVAFAASLQIAVS